MKLSLETRECPYELTHAVGIELGSAGTGADSATDGDVVGGQKQQNRQVMLGDLASDDGEHFGVASRANRPAEIIERPEAEQSGTLLIESVNEHGSAPDATADRDDFMRWRCLGFLPIGVDDGDKRRAFWQTCRHPVPVR